MNYNYNPFPEQKKKKIRRNGFHFRPTGPTDLFDVIAV